MPSSEGPEGLRNVKIATALANRLERTAAAPHHKQSQVNLRKWSCLFMQALCALVAIAMVHSDKQACLWYRNGGSSRLRGSCVNVTDTGAMTGLFTGRRSQSNLTHCCK